MEVKIRDSRNQLVVKSFFAAEGLSIQFSFVSLWTRTVVEISEPKHYFKIQPNKVSQHTCDYSKLLCSYAFSSH